MSKGVFLKAKLPATFNPKIAGCCMVASRILAGQLLEQGINCSVVEGWVQFVDGDYRGKDLRFAHTWLEFDDEILDLTLEQFEEYLDFYPFEREHQCAIPATEYLATLELNTPRPEIFFSDEAIPAECAKHLQAL